MTAGPAQRAADSKISVAKHFTWTTSLMFHCLLVAFFLPADVSVEALPARIPRIGYLVNHDPKIALPSAKEFRQGLRDLGYIEGENILIELRSAEGKNERFPSLVAELMQLKVDVLVSGVLTAILDAKQVTKTIPIVVVTTADPVAAGLADSFVRPGGNITGLTLLARDLIGKRLELIKEAMPKTSRIGFLLQADNAAQANRLHEYEAAARALKIPLKSVAVRYPNPDFDRAFQAASKEQVNALIVVRYGLFTNSRKQIADLAIKNRLGLVGELSSYVESGGLMSYSPDEAEAYRRAAYYVDRILKGAKPGDLPIEQPTKFELVINLNTAKQIGLTIPHMY
jgi:putative tryptophan/tyrosine transport system substrate-binding protein